MSHQADTIAAFSALPWIRKIHVLTKLRIVDELPRNQGVKFGLREWAEWTERLILRRPPVLDALAAEVDRVTGVTRAI